MRRILMAFAFATSVILAGCAKTDGGDLRLLYWNIQNGMWSEQGNGYDNFVSYVKDVDPDICVWCEAATLYLTGSDKSMPRADRYLPSNWKELAGRYGHEYVFLTDPDDSYPQVVTSRFPIEEVGIFEADPSVLTHKLGWVKVKFNGRDINVVPIHTFARQWGLAYRGASYVPGREESAARHEGDVSRTGELKFACEHTILTSPDPDGEYWMMLGDFNSVSRADDFHYGYPSDTAAYFAHDYMMNDTPYHDVIAERRKPDDPMFSDPAPSLFCYSHSNLKRIDYVYLSKALMDCVQSAEIVHHGWPAMGEKKGANIPVRDENVQFDHPSDHLPIIVDFKF